MNIDGCKTELINLKEVSHKLSKTIDVDELLSIINHYTQQLCQSEKASILLVDEEANELFFRKALGELGIIKRIRIPLNENSIAGWCVINKLPSIVNDTSQDPRHYKKVDQMTKFETKSILAVPIIWSDKVYGVIEAINKLDDMEFSDQDKELLTILANQAAVALNNVYVMKEHKNFFIYSIEMLISALEAIDPKMKGHTFRIARWVSMISRELGLDSKEIENMWYSAYFHDIGKLKRDENDMMHPITGAQMVDRINILKGISPNIKYHHERYDGSGYPDSLKGEQIPLGARIIGLVEDYDDKLYQYGVSQPKEEFIEEFFQEARKVHDPKLVNVFYKILHKS